MNPDIARQQIEGGLLYGMGLAIGAPIRFEDGTPTPRRIGALGLPLLATMPEISVELVRSSEAPGGLGEIAVPPVGPAIANALFAGSGRRFRTLPINATASLGPTGR
jgi:isoquinoline 1-oxidoreductase subunit beta